MLLFCSKNGFYDVNMQQENEMNDVLPETTDGWKMVIWNEGKIWSVQMNTSFSVAEMEN